MPVAPQVKTGIARHYPQAATGLTASGKPPHPRRPPCPARSTWPDERNARA